MKRSEQSCGKASAILQPGLCRAQAALLLTSFFNQNTFAAAAAHQSAAVIGEASACVHRRHHPSRLDYTVKKKKKRLTINFTALSHRKESHTLVEMSGRRLMTAGDNY